MVFSNILCTFPLYISCVLCKISSHSSFILESWIFLFWSVSPLYIIDRYVLFDYLALYLVPNACTLSDSYSVSIFSKSVASLFIFNIMSWGVDILILMEFVVVVVFLLWSFWVFFFVPLVSYLNFFCLIHSNYLQLFSFASFVV